MPPRTGRRGLRWRRTSRLVLREVRRAFFCEVTLLLEGAHLSTQPGQLGTLVGGERSLGIALLVNRDLAHPRSEAGGSEVELACDLRDGLSGLTHEAHCLGLELGCKHTPSALRYLGTHGHLHHDGRGMGDVHESGAGL